MRTSLFAAITLSLALAAGSLAQTRKTLDIYVVDVEGGNATLFVAPSGESLLIDTGNGGPAAVRDADRILAAVKDAGVTQIDHLITTHWHGDHFGAMAELAGRIPISEFIDHGAERPAAAGRRRVPARTSYPTLYGKAQHTVAKPGDKIAIDGLDWRVVASAGQAHQDSRCPAPASRIRTAPRFKPQDRDPSENAQSVGSIITFGKFRVAAPRRSDVEQGVRSDVPEQPDRHGGSLRRVASRAGDLELAAVLVHALAAARGHHEQRHAQRRAAGRDEDPPLLARVSRISGSCISRC